MKSNIPSTNLQEGLGKLELPVPAGGTLVTITFKGQRPSGVIKTEWTIDNQSTNSEDLRQKAVSIAYGFVPLPSGCSNCWGDLGQGCTDECRNSSAQHSEKIDKATAAILDLLTSHTKSAVIAELEGFQHGGTVSQYSIKKRIAEIKGAQ